MKLILMSSLQALLGVGGMAMLTNALGGKATSAMQIVYALASPFGIAGIALMLTAGVVMFIIFTYAKLSAFVPISTAAAFLFTVLVSVLYQGEKLSLSLVLGMAMILGGIVVVSKS
ncbi:MAG: hypothetical protein HYX66_05795 [Ignavibacteria bacterium]|nr:hypothetical protein [Ignavibacteria bacterium]